MGNGGWVSILVDTGVICFERLRGVREFLQLSHKRHECAWRAYSIECAV